MQYPNTTGNNSNNANADKLSINLILEYHVHNCSLGHTVVPNASVVVLAVHKHRVVGNYKSVPLAHMDYKTVAVVRNTAALAERNCWQLLRR